MKIIRSFAIELPVWQEFIKICQREGESASQKLQKWIAEYNERHRAGNPQIPLERYQDKPVQKCQLCNQPQVHLWDVEYRSGKILASCKSCIDLKRSKRLVRRVLKLTEYFNKGG